LSERNLYQRRLNTPKRNNHRPRPARRTPTSPIERHIKARAIKRNPRGTACSNKTIKNINQTPEHGISRATFILVKEYRFPLFSLFWLVFYSTHRVKLNCLFFFSMMAQAKSKLQQRMHNQSGSKTPLHDLMRWRALADTSRREIPHATRARAPRP